MLVLLALFPEIQFSLFLSNEGLKTAAPNVTIKGKKITTSSDDDCALFTVPSLRRPYLTVTFISQPNIKSKYEKIKWNGRFHFDFYGQSVDVKFQSNRPRLFLFSRVCNLNSPFLWGMCYRPWMRRTFFTTRTETRARRNKGKHTHTKWEASRYIVRKKKKAAVKFGWQRTT